MDNQTLFATARLASNVALEPAGEKPAVAVAATALVLGINAQKANGIDNFNARGVFGSDLFAAPSEGGKAILNLSSRPNQGNWLDKIKKQMSDSLSRMNSDSAPTGSSDSSGGAGSGATSSAPVSFGASARGGSTDAGLANAIAQLSGASIRPEHFIASETVEVPVDHVPTRMAPIVALVPEPEGLSL